MICKEFAHQGISSNQADADADILIATTAWTLSKSQPMPVVVIGTDMNLLVIIVSQATLQMNLHMCGKNSSIVHDTQAIHKAIHTHLMTLHAISDCHTLSALFDQRKREGFPSCSKGRS